MNTGVSNQIPTVGYGGTYGGYGGGGYTDFRLPPGVRYPGT